MKKLAPTLIFAVPAALFCVAAYLILAVPSDHSYRVAAYVITWMIQLGYLAWLGLKWRSQERAGNLGPSRQSPGR